MTDSGARPLLTRLISVLCLAAALPATAADAGGASWEGAFGLIASNAPSYLGSDQRTSKLLPGFFLRWGRVTVTNASGFVTRRNDDVERGLGVELSDNDRLRVNLSLRFDGGRDEGDSEALRGLGDVKFTLRTRLNGAWQWTPSWKLAAGVGVDTLGRGGGTIGDIGIQHESRPGPDTTLNLGAALGLADGRYMRTYFGVDEAQSQRSGYAPYSPSAGLRDLSLSASVRSDLGPRWVALGGVSVSRLLGPALDSPLTRKSTGLRVSGGLAYRF